MLRKIIGTTGTRLLTAFFTFLVIVINAKTLGAEGVGIIGLIILNITIINLITSFVGGTAVVYFVPRYGWGKLVVLTIVWSAFVSVVAGLLLHSLNLIPAGYTSDVMYLSFLLSIVSLSQSVFLGQERIATNNSINLIQFTSVLLGLLFMLQVMHDKSIHAYITALYFSYIFTAVISLIILLYKPYKLTVQKVPTLHLLKELLHFGFFVQTASILQLFNYRLSYYLINHFAGLSVLGIYTIGVQVSEGVWIISRSMALVLYSHISNNPDKEQARQTTIKFFKLSFVASGAMLFALIILPASLYTSVFGPDFVQARSVILLMGVGILAVAQNAIFSHFFSGTARYYHNTIGSGIGLLFTLIFGFILIPPYQLYGAALTATIAYLSSFTYQIVTFIKITDSNYLELLPQKSDFKAIVKEYAGIFK